MNIFLSFRYTGETIERLQEVFYPVRDALQRMGHEVYLSLDDLETWCNEAMPMREKFARTFAKLSAADVLLVIVRSADRSEGMLMEVGYALGQQKEIILVLQEGVETYVREVATKTILFKDFDSLLHAVRGIGF